MCPALSQVCVSISRLARGISRRGRDYHDSKKPAHNVYFTGIFFWYSINIRVVLKLIVMDSGAVTFGTLKCHGHAYIMLAMNTIATTNDACI